MRTQIGDVTLMAQGMTGFTLIRPSKTFYSDTHFESAYLLAGWTLSEDWRLAARADVFANDEKRPSGANLSERERTAMVLYASGLTIDSVARRMGVKSSTAAEFIKRVREKYLKAGNAIPTKADLYRQARDEGLVP